LITKLEFSFLCACEEAVSRQQELMPLLAYYLRVKPEEVFYHWAIPPRCKQVGVLGDTGWKYFFHGSECDLKNTRDGRFLRLDFGPHGRFDTFSGFGILQFVMTSIAPWREFPELRTFLAETPPPYNELSGSHAKMVTFADRIQELKLVEVADPKLCELVKKYTHIQPNGSHVTSLPNEFNNPAERNFWNAQVCKRWVLSGSGKYTIKTKEQVLD
jgi:hypothetical protein